MGNLRPGADIIYESPDGGDTVYARYMGETDRWLVGNLSKFRGTKHQEMQENQLWHDIRTTAKTNPALQEALDRAIIIYELIKKQDG